VVRQLPEPGQQGQVGQVPVDGPGDADHRGGRPGIDVDHAGLARVDDDGIPTDTELTLFDQDGTTIVATGDDAPANRANAAGAFTTSALGTFFVRIRNGGATPDDDYRFVVLQEGASRVCTLTFQCIELTQPGDTAIITLTGGKATIHKTNHSSWNFAANCAAAAGLCTVTQYADATPAVTPPVDDGSDPNGMLCGR
jgi:hypothetical protein